MKKIINKNTIFGFLIGIIITGSISVLATNYLYQSEDVSYNGTQPNVKAALDELFIMSNEKSSITFTLNTDDFISATQDYGVTSGTDIGIPFQYDHAEITISQATPNYAYIYVAGGNKEGIYSTSTTIKDIIGMTSISIRAGTGFHSHLKCVATITFYF